MAQNLAPAGASKIELVVRKLPPAYFPPIALAAHVFGDVELTVAIRTDGTIDSVEVVSGPPMLRQAAIDSAKQTQFVCADCKQSTTSFRVLYRYQLGPTIYCTDTTSNTGFVQGGTYPRISASMNTITITGQPIGTCDWAIDRSRIRSVRCFFLWKCGWR
jgi:hypothetical protein